MTDMESKEERQARLFYKNRFVRALNLYSLIGLGVIAAADLLLAGIGLIIDSPAQDLTWLYVALGASLAVIIALALLAGLIFAGGAPYSRGRLTAIDATKLVIRLLSVLAGAGFFVAALNGSGGANLSWNSFLRTYAIVIMAAEGLMALYSIWRLAWMKANPERYEKPAPRPYVEEKNVAEPARKDASGKTAEPHPSAPKPLSMASEPIDAEALPLPETPQLTHEDGNIRGRKAKKKTVRKKKDGS
jgi:hypothetical protein